MYFVTLSLLHVVENTFEFVLSWVPFYSWIRLFIHLYLILPGSQGATFIYREYIDPFLYHHEREIDNLITDIHEKARSSGLQYINKAIEWVKVNFLGFAPRQPSPPPSRQASYAQSLLSRFNVPAARGNADLVGLVSAALSGASNLYSGNQNAQAEAVRSSGIIPENIRDDEERLTYLNSQRQRLATLIQAFDREQDYLTRRRNSGSRRGEGGLSKSRSETEFDRIDPDEVDQDRPPPYPVTPPIIRRESSGWMPWNWQRQVRPSEQDPLAYGDAPSQGRSSGYDRGR
jgi:receptor expression-enhancing protein 1/2/3/4